MLTRDEINGTFHKKDKPSESPEQIAISNSMGMGCADVEWVKQDIAKARASIGDGQLLIVSVFGSGENEQAVVDDFVATAQMAQNAGAQVIELNLSCPNINAHDYPYKNISFSDLIIRAVAKAVCVPVTTKVGLFDNQDQMRAFLIQAACAGAKGICGINSVPVKIVNDDGKPFFGDNRQISGLSGAPLRELAKEFIQNAREIIDRNKLNLTLFATGGITTSKDFDEYLKWGADVALTATGFMCNPLMANEYKIMKNIIRLGSSKL
jgi:dihydroorotate dehydrogenase